MRIASLRLHKNANYDIHSIRLNQSSSKISFSTIINGFGEEPLFKKSSFLISYTDTMNQYVLSEKKKRVKQTKLITFIS